MLCVSVSVGFFVLCCLLIIFNCCIRSTNIPHCMQLSPPDELDDYSSDIPDPTESEEDADQELLHERGDVNNGDSSEEEEATESSSDESDDECGARGKEKPPERASKGAFRPRLMLLLVLRVWTEP